MREGKLGFFKGLRLNFYRSVIYQYLTGKLYATVKSDYNKLITGDYHQGKRTDYFILFLSSWTANSLITLGLYPFELIKTKMMTEISPDADPRYSSIGKSWSYVKSTYGLRGLYRGLSVKLGFMALQFSSLTGLYYLLENDGKMETNISTFLGLSAVNVFIFYPWDTLLKNIQLQGFMNVKESIQGSRATMSKTIRAGPRALYAGAHFYIVNNLLVLGLQQSILSNNK